MTPAERADAAWREISSYDVWLTRTETRVIERHISAAVAAERAGQAVLARELAHMATELQAARGAVRALRDAAERLLAAEGGLPLASAEASLRRALRETEGDG